MHKATADSLIAGFNVADYTVYENENAKYVVFDVSIVEAERRYATIIDGKMGYFIASTDGKTTPAQQRNNVKQVRMFTKY